jgi:hypothetical protein
MMKGSGINSLYDKKKGARQINNETPYNNLPLLPPVYEKVETKKVLRQLVKSSVALA